ncbi:MAG: anti-sigma factor [Actinomycetota bacterium]|nr:anti-sigma factor [Actinomycetota bacterium]
MNEHRRVRDLLGPYVQDSLEPEEKRQVRAHLRRCESCRVEELDLRMAHDHLTELASTTQAPPPDLKTRVMVGVPRRRTRRLPLFAAAAVLVALVVLALLYPPGIFVQETVAKATLEATELAPQAGGELRVQKNDPNARATLEVWNLPRPKSDEYYELWFGNEEGRISAGTFTVDAEGRGTLDMTAPERVGDYQRVGITLEEFPKEPRMDSAKVVLGGELRES